MNRAALSANVSNTVEVDHRPRLGLVVHGHREGHAPGGRAWISQECLARVTTAEQVAARRGIADVLLCGAGATGRLSEARQMAQAWTGPDVRLWLDEHSIDSAQNAQYAYVWSRIVGVTHLVVVSSWWHVRLPLYYRPLRSQGLRVSFAPARRCSGVVGHLAHELRYLPEAVMRSDSVAAEATQTVHHSAIRVYAPADR